MNLENFIENVIKLTQDIEIRQELEKGLKIQITIGKEKINFIVLRPEIVQKEDKERT